jgi:Resolvase, N terminal domain
MMGGAYGDQADGSGGIRPREQVGGRGGDSFLSPELQREQIAFAARREGLEIVDVLEELDASGGDRTREKWNEAIRRVEDGEVGAVVVWNLSCFSRSIRDALDALGRIEAAGGRVVSATEQFGDDATGRMTATSSWPSPRTSGSVRRRALRPPRPRPSSGGSTSRARSRTATSAARTDGCGSTRTPRPGPADARADDAGHARPDGGFAPASTPDKCTTPTPSGSSRVTCGSRSGNSRQTG